jgi:hypothetical protein
MNTGARRQGHGGISSVAVVVPIMVVVAVPTVATHVLQFLATLACLLAVFAVTVDGLAQFLLGLVNASFAALVGADGNGGSYEPNDCQQGN